MIKIINAGIIFVHYLYKNIRSLITKNNNATYTNSQYNTLKKYYK